MANKQAILTFSLVYTGPQGQRGPANPIQMSAPYQAMSSGSLDVPDLTAQATVYAVPFGSISDVTSVLVVNSTGQDLGVRWNGVEADEYQVPDGAAVVYWAPGIALANKVTGLSLVTTAEQAGAGTIDYYVFGDPEAVPA